MIHYNANNNICIQIKQSTYIFLQYTIRYRSVKIIDLNTAEIRKDIIETNYYSSDDEIILLY